ncbi:lycopene beta-cyclase CrtY [Parvularcula flava]|uniref:Lycopene beta-cyclase CrtY n=1 Tax=Aquisalinus luteolus TaxID=1566827 RepID=A0A8J3EP20_9PROT|nr:lycopene beta-cyclase CrtY [Aquisalinus luteolus]NHK26816.1 lycopene beta-cyclase CrtY [Aquisalinus luteolus]GGH93499.1 hypothetical protein GCM10011355_05480 [Aquisalinus luteolus]
MTDGQDVRDNTITADVALAGGGLANGLIAWRLAQVRPDLKILIVEAGQTLGGNHTWSFHETDVTPDQHDWMAPFIVHRWNNQQVSFPERQRRLETGYRSITSERFDEVLRSAPNISVITGTPVDWLSNDVIGLTDERRIEAPLVIDGRGYYPSPHLQLGWQKFLGQHVRLEKPHGLDAPVIMDADIPQEGGYRFIYLLPFTDTEVLIEDTYYADDDALDTDALRRRIATYAQNRGWQIAEVIREEDGILPITLGGDIEAYWRDYVEAPPSGLRAALFHPVTGYSLPDAVRVADLIAAQPSLRSNDIVDAMRSYAIESWHSQRFYRLLNRMLFWAAKPTERYKVLQRFYGLSPRLIERFYAGQNTLGDKIRILAGKPPVPIHRALPCLAGRHPDGISPVTERA